MDTRLVMGLAIWIFGFALMTAGWLVGELFEEWGRLPSKILHKTGAVIVAVPVILLLWKAAAALYVHRLDVALRVNEAFRFFGEALRSL